MPFGIARERFFKKTIVASHLSRFARNEGASATIESVLWLPVFVAFLGIVADGSVILSNRTMALKLVQDANRSLAVGRFTSTAQTEQFVLNNIRPTSPSATVTTTVNAGIITTRLAMPASEIDAVGIFGLLTGFTVGVRASHLRES